MAGSLNMHSRKITANAIPLRRRLGESSAVAVFSMTATAFREPKTGYRLRNKGDKTPPAAPKAKT
jgi:hypothetical protein